MKFKLNWLNWQISYLFLILSFLVFLAPKAALTAEVNGIFMVVKGSVTIIPAKSSSSGGGEVAKVGRKVFPGDTIVAEADSRAKIAMSDNNVLNISPSSKIQISKYENDGKDKKNVEINVLYGKIRASVEQKYDGEKNKFNVRTPTAVAGVRGTDFLTSFQKESKKSEVISFSGVVAVGAPGPRGEILNPVMIKPGQTTSVKEGRTPEPPKTLSKEDVNKMNKESTATESPGPAPSKTEAKESKEKQEKDQKSKDKTEDKTAKKDDKKNAEEPLPKRGPQSESDSLASKENAPTGGDSVTREPTSMISGRDLGPDLSKEITIAPPSALTNPSQGSLIVVPPPTTNVYTPPNLNNSFINDATRNTKSKVQIIIQPTAK